MVCVKYRAPHYEKFNFSIIPSRTKRSTSFLNIYSYDFSTGYGCIHIDLTFYFNYKPAGSDFFVPSFTFNNSSKKFNRLSKSFCWKIYGGFDISTSNQYLGIITLTSYFLFIKYPLGIFLIEFCMMILVTVVPRVHTLVYGPCTFEFHSKTVSLWLNIGLILEYVHIHTHQWS